MIIYILIAIIILPVLLGYWIEATEFIRRVIVNFNWSKFKIIPENISNEIKIRKEIIAEELYFKEELPHLKSSTRSGNGGEKIVWDIAERLSHVDHKRQWSMSSNKELPRPQYWIRFIIAQIIRK